MVTIEKPTPISSSPMPTVQRRSKPVNGRSFEVAAFVVGVLVVLVEGDTAVAGVLASFDGDVPLAGVTAGVVAGVVAGGVVVVGVGGFWA
jgi:hypothetical protein